MSWLDLFLAPTAHDARPSFSPLLPLRLPSLPHRHPPHPPPPPSRPARPFVCPLPPPGAVASRPPFAVGHGADAWSDHFAWLARPNARGQRLFIQRWLPTPPPPPPLPPSSSSPSSSSAPSSPVAAAASARQLKAVVHLVHGLSAHGSAYASLARALVAEGYVVVAHDAHGHGRSDGFRGHACSIDHYVDDARVAVAEARRRLPAATNTLPRILLGHSLGGAVAIHLAAASRPCDWAGVVLTAPAVAVFSNPLLRFFAPILATFAPLMPVQRVRFDGSRSRKTQRRDADITRTPAALDVPRVAMGWRPWALWPKRRSSADSPTEPPGKDPLLLRGPVRARLGYEVLKSCARIMRCAPTFRAPVFVAHSREDRATNAQGSIDFVSKIASADKSIKLYEGNTHDLLAARGRQHKRAVRDIVKWMNKRVERYPGTCPSSTRGRGGRRSCC